MERFVLLSFFHDLIKLGIDMPGRPGFGSPISWLLEQMCLHQDRMIDRITGDYTNDSHEWRINTAGLKMHWRVQKSGDKRRFTCYISGDQARDYTGFVVAARKLIEQYKYGRR